MKQVTFIGGPSDGETFAVGDAIWRHGYVEVRLSPSPPWGRPSEDEHPTIEKRSVVYRLHDPLSDRSDFAWGLPDDWDVKTVGASEGVTAADREYVPASDIWDRVGRELDHFANTEGFEILKATAVRDIESIEQFQSARYGIRTYARRLA